MNKRLKEILKEYEKRKHKIIKGDESMNIVVLAGGTSTEREISIVTGTGVCKVAAQDALIMVVNGDRQHTRLTAPGLPWYNVISDT